MKRLLLMLMTVSLCIAAAGCQAGSTFEGSVISDADSFRIDYTLLDRQEDSSLVLDEGDTLRVSIAQEAGTVDVTVGLDGEQPVYEGNRLVNVDFVLNISKSGTYQITVTGHDARGSAAFIRAAAEPEDEAGRQSAMYAAYQAVLRQIAFEHIYPDGTDTGFDSAGGFMGDNGFALSDVNGDGTEELIVRFVTAPMAENLETVYSYNEAENTVDELLAAFPAVTYYDSGLVKEEWSHGSGLAGEDYRPYNLYRYREDADTYELIAEVNMWSKAVDAVDYKGDPYPEDVDEEHTGTVFILTRGGTTETVSKREYETWLSEIMGSARPVQVPYQPMSEENIMAVCKG